MLNRIFFALARRGLLNWIPSRFYLKHMYKTFVGRTLNLKSPKRFNEKLQWLKINDRKDIYTDMVDKYTAKKIAAEKIGSKYIIPTLGVWENFRSIDFKSLPSQFVIKCTHDSGGVVICKDFNTFNKGEANRIISNAMKKNFYSYTREWPYKNIKPRIIVEKFLDCGETDLIDYKVMCFEGKPRLIQVHQGRSTKHTQDLFNTEWNVVDATQVGYPKSDKLMSKPVFLDEMLSLSQKLAEGIHHIRIDWYYVNGQLYFGEFTFFDGSGLSDFIPDEYNDLLGSWIAI